MRILRLKQVLDITGLSRSTLYLYMSRQQFPNQVKLGPKIVGWIDEEVENWISSRVNQRRADDV